MGSLDSTLTRVVSVSLPRNALPDSAVFVASMNMNGDISTVTKVVPISAPSTIHLHVYPESGETVCGYRNRVFFESLDSNNRTVSVTGVVETPAGKTVSSLESGVDGRGQFSVLFSHPEEEFLIRILTPKNVANPVIPLKLPCMDSVLLTVSEKAENGTVSATVSSKRETEVVVTLWGIAGIAT